MDILLFGSLAYPIYLLVFVAAAAGCLAGAWQARGVSLPGVRQGLIGLLVASGLWALCHVGVLLSPGLGLKTAFYEAGLIVGFGTVFGWLWLCSSYSGRSLHRRKGARWAAASVFVVVTAMKLTNRWHGLYFSAELSGEPFRHLAVDHHVIYWGTAGLSYALAAVGFFMLAEPLRRAKVGGRKLAGLFALTALPLGANAVGYAGGGYLLELSHEPVGVAAFALGALALKGGQLEETSRAGREERPSLVLSGGGRIRNYNQAAARLFPALQEKPIRQDTTASQGVAAHRRQAAGSRLEGTLLEETLPRLSKALGRGAEKTGKVESGETQNGELPEEDLLEEDVLEENVLKVTGEEGEARYLRPVETVAQRGAGRLSAHRLVTLEDVTERELRRREQASRIESISDHMPGVAFEFRVGPGGGRSVEFVGGRAESFLGLSSGPGQSYERFVGRIPEGSREAFSESVESAVESRSEWRHEFPFERPGGERMWILGSAEPETLRPSGSSRADEGTPALLFRGLLLGVTERKEAERELRKEKRRLQSITENVSDGIYRSTAEEGIVYANSAFVEMFGYQDLGELRAAGGKTLYDDPARREELIEEEMEEGGLGREEVRYRRKDGTVFTGLLSTRQVEGEEEGKTYFDGAITDVTERTKERQRREETIRRTTDGIVEVGAEWRVTLVNDQAEKIYGAGEEEMLGESIWEVFGGLEGTEFEEVYREAMRSREPAEIEGHFEGLGEWFAEQVYPNEGGGLAIYSEEITDRKERERALREAKEEAEKTRAEAEEAQVQAEQAARLKSSMLANMSHEIRTPLTSIIGFAEAIGTECSELDLSGGSPLPKYADLIEQGGKRLLETLEGVLTLSKLEAGQMELSAETVDLSDQARRAAEELRAKAEEKGVGLELKTRPAATAGPEVTAEADEGGVQIVLRNLLSNAIKYTDEGTVRVRTYRENGQENGRAAATEVTAAVLEVEDTGIGMDPEAAEGLFEPFRQASEGWSREYEGTGIGLAVTREAVEQMGGTIEVDTEEGEGTRVTVRLPLAGQAEAA